jgi:small GTP-binding protein
LISKKVILTGSFGVGKSSLFNRFIDDRFDERYLTTVGVKVNSKTIEIDGQMVTLLLWDIAGEARQDKVPPAYFLGSAGIIYVFDLSRPMTKDHLEYDLEYLKNLLPFSATRIVGNKADLVTPEQLADIIKTMTLKPDVITSAKTGERVNELFYGLAKEFL